MRASRAGFEMILILFAGIVALFAPTVLKTKSLGFIIAPHALLIVIGGTLCAVCMSFSFREILSAFCSLKSLFTYQANSIQSCAQDIIEISKIARSKGFLEAAQAAQYSQNPFLQSAAEKLADNTDIKSLEENLKLTFFCENKNDFKNIEIFEEMGGYAPTFGIIGAIIGLVQISALSSDPKSLLSGIATAFIATVYGVGSANLIFIPIAKKLKNILEDKLLEQEIIISSILDMANNQSSIIISEKLNRFLYEKQNTKVIPFAA